jgi:hypothetical protein
VIGELAALASRKLADARRGARSEVEKWQSAFDVVESIEREFQFTISLPGLSRNRADAASEFVKQSDYLTALRLREEARAAARSVLRCAVDDLRRAEGIAAGREKAAADRVAGIASSFPPPSEDIVSVYEPLAILGTIVGWAFGNLLWLIFWRGRGLLGFVLGWLAMPIVGWFSWPLLVISIRKLAHRSECEAMRDACRQKEAPIIEAMAAEGRRIQSAIQAIKSAEHRIFAGSPATPG